MTQEQGSGAVAQPSAVERGHEFDWLDWLLLVGLLIAAVAVAYLTAMAIWRFAESSVLLGFVEYSLLPSTLPASLQTPFTLGLKPPPGLTSALPGCGTW